MILIPLGGTGQRFKKYTNTPKALITVFDRPIISWLFDNLHISSDQLIVIPYNHLEYGSQLEDYLKEKYPIYNFHFCPIYHNTKGPSETIKIALTSLPPKYSSKDEPVISIDADNFYLNDIISIWNGENKVIAFNSTDQIPYYSYIQTDDNINIKQIKEKEKISDIACSGAYGFASWKQLLHYATILLDKTDSQEPYISHIIQEMINNNISFNFTLINNYHSLGTPKQISSFKEQFTFLFDLDGTLVDTDHIYTKVWKKIMKDFNISIDQSFFDNFIKGKSDYDFLTYMISNISENDIKKISNLKDELFIKEINEIPYIHNSLNFIKMLKGAKIAIVTNSNRKAALKLCQELPYDFLISATDCKNRKPNPEPYLKAIEKFNAKEDTTFIFEDSGTGYISAKSTNYPNIILIDNENTKDLVAEKIKTFDQIDINKLLFKQENKYDPYIKQLENILSIYPIKFIEKNKKDLKTGYICNIYSYKLHYFNHKDNIVLKIKNTGNELSKTASLLDLYGKEEYFYKYLSSYVNVKIPKFYGILDNAGIVMEQLENGNFNLDLNNNINLLLNVVYEISKLHNKFYFKTKYDVIESMKNLKKVNDINYYKQLISDRFSKFIEQNKKILSEEEIFLLTKIKNNYKKIQDDLSNYPLSFCHGDLKSPNIFYTKDDIYLLDWQYIHLNKGVSDITFLLVESIKYNPNIINIVKNYYYELTKHTSYEEYEKDFKNSLCSFPFFVCVWFNSEDQDKLLDKIFPISFMKNLLKYYKAIL